MADGRSQGWYGLATYRVTDKISLSALYDVFYIDKNDRDGDHFVAQGQPDYYAWRKDFGVCLRYDVNYRWVLKAEWHDIDGAALGIPLYNPEGTAREWSYFAAKASFNF